MPYKIWVSTLVSRQERRAVVSRRYVNWLLTLRFVHPSAYIRKVLIVRVFSESFRTGFLRCLGEQERRSSPVRTDPSTSRLATPHPAPSRPAVHRPVPTRPWYVWILYSTGRNSCVRDPNETSGLLSSKLWKTLRTVVSLAIRHDGFSSCRAPLRPAFPPCAIPLRPVRGMLVFSILQV